ncbi:hypothetical protein DPMN_107580 [Dreissena polymorpha]|uniref:Uncharacterized protein n=1 Tax=Dreissena polymorpha TaxID=45954 RepID=A0A9D4K6Z6_DREPO|nr:hypothetical protein DPMN_107580 [Dreissena polymorpha]
MLTDLIKYHVIDMGFQRYKYIVTLIIGQDIHRGVRVVSRCMTITPRRVITILDCTR